MPGLIDAHTHVSLNEIPGKAPFPLQDVESLWKINFVMKNGKVVRSAK